MSAPYLNFICMYFLLTYMYACVCIGTHMKLYALFTFVGLDCLVSTMLNLNKKSVKQKRIQLVPHKLSPHIVMLTEI